MRKTVFSFLLLLLCLSLSARGRAPLIGISASLTRSGGSTLSATYSDAVRKAGGIPVILPVLTDSALVSQVVARMDGLLFSGGEDFDPARYGEAVIPEAGVDISPVRDTSDLLYARAGLRARKPILGICRGAQLLNVAAGGTLYQDLPLQHPGPVTHRQTAPPDQPGHLVICPRNSFLYGLYGLDTLAVNSFHHQAVKDLAPRYRVAAVAEDGIVEAFECSGVWAVQFHPEKAIAAGDENWLPFFRAFVARCRH